MNHLAGEPQRSVGGISLAIIGFLLYLPPCISRMYRLRKVCNDLYGRGGV